MVTTHRSKMAHLKTSCLIHEKIKSQRLFTVLPSQYSSTHYHGHSQRILAQLRHLLHCSPILFMLALVCNPLFWGFPDVCHHSFLCLFVPVRLLFHNLPFGFIQSLENQIFLRKLSFVKKFLFTLLFIRASF